jgi:hypothetical protein
MQSREQTVRVLDRREGVSADGTKVISEKERTVSAGEVRQEPPVDISAAVSAAVKAAQGDVLGAVTTLASKMSESSKRLDDFDRMLNSIDSQQDSIEQKVLDGIAATSKAAAESGGVFTTETVSAGGVALATTLAALYKHLQARRRQEEVDAEREKAAKALEAARIAASYGDSLEHALPAAALETDPVVAARKAAEAVAAAKKHATAVATARGVHADLQKARGKA